MPQIDFADFQEDQLDTICSTLANGQCVAIPTETVYGLAADATSGQAVAKIFQLKGRPKFNPLICHVDGMEMAGKHGIFDPVSVKLTDAFWPGPLTIVVPVQPDSNIHDLVTAGLDTVGLRCPSGPMNRIIAAYGRPLAAPSANRSGKISPTTADHVWEEFGEDDLLVLDAGPCPEGIESTIVKVADDAIHILRPGSITPDMIIDATGMKPKMSASGKIEAPGMMKSHYAPNASVTMDCKIIPEGAAMLGFGGKIMTSGSGPSRNLSETGDLKEAAAKLYTCLKELDATGVEVICVSPIPNEGLGIAINDRLRRAAMPRN
ncbi:MAG: L-threonylcarbamoyladenylate synthase [Rhizobiaceae bacterium]